MMTISCNSDIDAETVEDLQELERLVPFIPAHLGDVEFRNQIYGLVEQLQDLCPYSSHSKLIRTLVAHFGEAYFFFNKTGDVCFLTDLVHELKSAEISISK